MAIVINSPKSIMVDVSQDPIMVEWTDSTEGQEAYELQYRFKKANVWSTCGKVYDAAARSVSLMNIYNLVGVDFYEVYYRLVIYYNGENTLGVVTGTETSPAYSIVFRHGIANTLKLWGGSGDFDYNIFDTIATDDTKTNREVEVLNIALDTSGAKLKAPIVAQDSILKSELRICVDADSQDIKNVAQDVSTFPNTRIYGKTYLVQAAAEGYDVYSYDYKDHYKKYEYYGYKPKYDYKPYTNPEDVYYTERKSGTIYQEGWYDVYDYWNGMYGDIEYYKRYYSEQEGYDVIDVYGYKPTYQNIYRSAFAGYYVFTPQGYDKLVAKEYYVYIPYVVDYHTETIYSIRSDYNDIPYQVNEADYKTIYKGELTYTYFTEFYFYYDNKHTEYVTKYKYAGDYYSSQLHYDRGRYFTYHWEGGYFTEYTEARYYYTVDRGSGLERHTGRTPQYEIRQYIYQYTDYKSEIYYYTSNDGTVDIPVFERKATLGGYIYTYVHEEYDFSTKVYYYYLADTEVTGYYKYYVGRTTGDKYYYYKDEGYTNDYYEGLYYASTYGYDVGYDYLAGHWLYYYISGSGTYYLTHFDYTYYYNAGYTSYIKSYYRAKSYSYMADYQYAYSYVSSQEYQYYYYKYYRS